MNLFEDEHHLNNAVSLQLNNILPPALEYFKEALNTATPGSTILRSTRSEDDEKENKNDLSIDHVCAIITHIKDDYQDLGDIGDGLIYFQELLKIIRKQSDTNKNTINTNISSTSTTTASTSISRASFLPQSVEIEVKVLICLGNLHYIGGNFQEARIAFDEASSLIPLAPDSDNDDDENDNNLFQEQVRT